MNILITAGPTREYLDPVRYISNDSSGKMGYALAHAALKDGHKVTIISGPVDIIEPRGARVINVISAREMFAEVKRRYKKADIIIMTAAVADFRPFKFSRTKIKKARALAHSRTHALKLVKNPDILEWLGSHKRPDQMLVGFALETGDLIKNARKKLLGKNCDIIIANKAAVIGKSETSFCILDRSGNIRRFGPQGKPQAAKAILNAISGRPRNIKIVD